MTVNFIFGDRAKIMDVNGDIRILSWLQDQILNWFPYFLNKEGYMEISMPARLSATMRVKINDFCNEFAKHDKRAHRLRTFFNGYPDGTPFFCKFGEVSDEESQNMQALLLCLDSPDPNQAYQLHSEFKQKLLSAYDIIHEPGITKRHIGEPDKNKRVCRYCGRSMPEVTFKQVAHTVSESLGNKNIITNTECDECNNRYGTVIERDFANLHHFIRGFYNISGKDKMEYKSSNFTISHQPDGSIKIGIKMPEELIKSTEEKERQTGELNLLADSGLEFIPLNIYKALCKYVIGILKDEDVIDFVSTIEWMDGKRDFPSLPSVLVNFPTGFRLQNPRLTICRRSVNDSSLPLAIGIVEFSDIAYGFVLPHVNDTVDYSNPELWNEVSAHLPLYAPERGWKKQDFSSSLHQMVKTNLKFSQKS